MGGSRKELDEEGGLASDAWVGVGKEMGSASGVSP
jgi:hypothetical protein